ncbi:MAG: SLC13 family permease [Hyphomicrobiaceae bacterium]
MHTAKRSLVSGLKVVHWIALASVTAAVFLIVKSFGGTVEDPLAWRTAGLLILAIGLFATHAIPEFLTGLIVLFLAVVLKIAPNQVIFTGFSVGGFWLLFSGIIIGQAVGHAGLGKFIAQRFLARVELTFARTVVLLVVVGTLLGFVVPATIPRIIILMPIAIGLAQAMGYQEMSRGYTGIAIAVATGTLFPTFMVMTANLPTVVHISVMDALYENAPSFSAWFTYLMPLSIFRAVVLIAIIAILFGVRSSTAQVADNDEPMTPKQKRLASILAITLMLWLTDTWHGIAPAWIALATAIVVLLPPLQLLPSSAMKEKIDLSPVFYVAGVLCIGAIMQHNGLDAQLGTAVLQHLGLEAGATILNYYLVLVMSVFSSMAFTTPAVPIMLVPLAGQISDMTGLSLMTVLMTQFVGFSTILFPYQVPPLVVALSLCRIQVRDLIKTCVLLAAAVFLLGAPLNLIWWYWIGLL